jgi:bla regulator protein blaR1
METFLIYLALGVAVMAVLGLSSNSSMRATGIWIGSLALVAMILPGLQTSHALLWAGTQVSISDDDEMTLTIRDRSLGLNLRLESDGEVRFNETEDDIAYLEPRSRLRIRQVLDGTEYLLLVTSDGDGVLSYDYERDGEAEAFDQEARAWLAAAIPHIYRASGLHAEERVARIHARGGPEAVLEEIEQIRGDYVQRIYYSELVTIVGTDDALADVYRHAGDEISSDFELRPVLSALPSRRDLNRAQSLAILEAASSIGSDFELSELLVSIAGQLDPHHDVALAYLDVARDIGSDFEMNKALDALATVGWIDQVPVDALFEASRRIGSDFELASFLTDNAMLSGRNDESFAAYLDAAREVGSDFELARVLKNLVHERDLEVEHLLAVIEMASAEISSDFEHSQVLMALAPQVEDDATLIRAYERSAERLGQHQYGQAMRALVSSR